MHSAVPHAAECVFFSIKFIAEFKYKKILQTKNSWRKLFLFISLLERVVHRKSKYFH